MLFIKLIILLSALFASYSPLADGRDIDDLPWPDQPPIELAPSSPVGVISGQSSINDVQGEFHYQIPLELPQGFDGLEIDLSIQYSSQQHIGNIALGWSLGGEHSTSRIMRCNKSYHQDGQAANITFTNSDNFCLDGMKLIRTAENQNIILPSGYVHPTLIPIMEFNTFGESFSRIIAFAHNSQSEILQWVQYRRDGSVHWYGTNTMAQMKATPVNSSSNQIIGWLRQKIVDSRNNELINFVYESQPVPAHMQSMAMHIFSKRLKQITYANGHAKVDFSYQQASNRPTQKFWKSGVLEYQNSYITEIHIAGKDLDDSIKTFKYYHLDYGHNITDPQPVEELPLLKRVSLCDQDAVCIGTDFSYTAPDSALRYTEVFDRPMPLVDLKTLSDITISDLNQDGLDDIIYNKAHLMNTQTVINGLPPAIDLTLHSHHNPLQIGVGSSLSYLFPHTSGDYVTPEKWHYPYTIKPFDHDGDGRPSILSGYLNPVNNQGDTYALSVDVFNMDTFHTFTPQSSQMITGLLSEMNPLVLDFDGDGYTEMAIASAANDKLIWDFFKFDKNAGIFIKDLQLSGLHSVRLDINFSVIDIDGNGTDDIIMSCSKQAELFQAHCTNDGDFWSIRMVAGTAVIGSWNAPNGANLLGSIWADYNGDGLKDLIYPYGLDCVSEEGTHSPYSGFYALLYVPVCKQSTDQDPHIYVAINTGAGFLNPQQVYENFGADYLTQSVIGVDMNGDGRDDLLFMPKDEKTLNESPTNLIMDHFNYVSDATPEVLISQNKNYVKVDYFTSIGDTLRDAYRIGDFDNDNWPELLVLTHDSTATDYSTLSGGQTSPGCVGGQCETGFHMKLFSKNDTENHYYGLLSEVKTGLGAIEKIKYARWIDVHQQCTNGTNQANCLVKGKPLVESHTIVQPQGDLITSYEYSAMRADPRLGFIGPKEVTISTQDQIMTKYYDPSPFTITASDQVIYPFSSSPVKVEVTHFDGINIISKTTQNWIFNPVISHINSKGQYSWWLSTTESHTLTESGGDNHLLDEYFRWDAYGNMTSRKDETTGTRNGQNLIGTKHESTLPHFNDLSNWHLGLLQSQTSTQTLNNQSTTQFYQYSYDNTGLLSSIERGNPVELNTYTKKELIRNTKGNITSIIETDMNGNNLVTETQYDSDGIFPVFYQDPWGEKTHILIHHGLSIPVFTHANNQLIEYHYDGFGRMVKKTDPIGPDVTVEFDQTNGLGFTVSKYSEDGSQLTSHLDFAGRSILETWNTFDGAHIGYSETEYDIKGRVKKKHLPKFNNNPVNASLQYNYDNLNRLNTIILPNGEKQQYTYNGLYQMQIETPHDGNQTRNSSINYNVNLNIDQTIHQSASGPISTVFKYNPMGQQIQSTDDAGHVISRTYDNWGRVTNVIDPNAGTWSTAWTAFDQVQAQIDSSNSHYISYTYTNGVRPKTRSASSPSTSEFTEYIYAGIFQNLSQIKYSDNNTTTERNYTYDNFGRINSDQVIDHSTGQSLVTRFDTDTLGRLQKITYPQSYDGHQISINYEYNTKGFLQRIHNNQQDLWQALSYYPSGGVKSDKRGHNLEATWLKDPLTNTLNSIRVKRLSDSSDLLHTTYEYTSGDFKLKSSQDQVNNIKQNFLYDKLGRLHEWSGNRDNTNFKRNYNFKYPTQVLDNIVENNMVTQYSYAATQPHATTKVQSPLGTSHYQYDNLGRIYSTTGIANRQMHYNSFDLPSEVINAAEHTTFYYDGTGQRVMKINDPDNWSIQSGYFTRQVKDGKLVDRHSIPGPSGVIAVIEYSSDNQQREDYFTFQDRMGSTVLVTKSSGDIADRFFYDPEGIVQDKLGQNQSLSDTADGFTGHQHDTKLGLINMKGRLFDPHMKKFLTPDIFTQGLYAGQGSDRYSYALFDPINKIDPDGMDPTDNWGDDGWSETWNSTTSVQTLSRPEIAAPYPVSYDLNSPSKGIESGSYFLKNGQYNGVNSRAKSNTKKGQQILAKPIFTWKYDYYSNSKTSSQVLVPKGKQYTFDNDKQKYSVDNFITDFQSNLQNNDENDDGYIASGDATLEINFRPKNITESHIGKYSDSIVNLMQRHHVKSLVIRVGFLAMDSGKYKDKIVNSKRFIYLFRHHLMHKYKFKMGVLGLDMELSAYDGIEDGRKQPKNPTLTYNRLHLTLGHSPNMKINRTDDNWQ